MHKSFGACERATSGRHVSKKWRRLHVLDVYFVSLSCFRDKKSCSIFYIVQFLLFAAFVSLRTNIRLRALSAARREYLRLEKWLGAK